MTNQILNLLIIDDEMPKWKGYEGIGDKFPGQFRIDRCKFFNLNNSSENALDLIRIKKYDLILLDYVLKGQPDQGPDILEDIRNGFEGYRMPSDECIINQDTSILGVSKEWRINDRENFIGWVEKPVKNFFYIDGKEPEELYLTLRKFLDENKKF